MLNKFLKYNKYRKIPKISPGAYIFRRPFWGGLISGGGYLRREICVTKLIELALQLEGNVFWLCFTLYLRRIFEYKLPAVGLYLEGRFNGGFFCVTSLGGLYLEGAYFRNFTVSIHQTLIKRKTQRALGVS